MADKFVICRRCGSDACYEIDEEKSIRWQCMDCGFTTNTYYLQGSEAVEHLKNSVPSLYRDLLFEDKEGLVWMPSTVAVSGKGTIFIHGSDVVNWHWCFAPDVVLNEEEKSKKKYSGMKYKTDMSQAQYFGQKDFVLAMRAAKLI